MPPMRMGTVAARLQWTFGDPPRISMRPSAFMPPYSTTMRRSAQMPRPFTQSSSSQLPRKDSQDRNSINTEATEYTKSGTDDQAARQEEAAFDPSKTSPEEEKATAGEGNQKEGNPLEVSPANPEVSKQRPQQEGGAEKGPDRDASSRKSGGGSPNKGKKLGE